MKQLNLFEKDFKLSEIKEGKVILKNNYSVFLKEIDPLPLVFSFDLETEGLDFRSKEIIIVGIGTKNNNYLIPLDYGKDFLKFEDIRNFLNKLLTSKSIKILHNFKFDAKFLREKGIIIQSPINDTLIMASLLKTNDMRGGCALKSLITTYLKNDLPEKKEKGLKDYISKEKLETWKDIPLSIITPYAINDIKYTLELYHLFSKLMKERDLLKIYNVEKELLGLIVEMEYKGLKISKKKLLELQSLYAGKELFTKKEIYKETGEIFNIDSDIELSKIFDKLKIQANLVKSKNPRAYYLNEEVLKNIKHPLGKKILEYRSITVIKRTFIDGILDKERENYLHPSFEQVGARTGRFSCREPNLQNLPRETEIREVIIPESNKYDFIFFDYSQIEIRLFAHYSQETKMIDALNRGEDLHGLVAKDVLKLDKPIEKLTVEERHTGKTINFGIIYEMGIAALARRLETSEGEAKNFMEIYFKRFPNIPIFQRQVRRAVEKRGYIKTYFGRRRYLNRAKSYRGINSLIQGTAADVLKIAMIRVNDYLKKENLESRICSVVHDEIIIHHLKTEKNLIEPIKKLIEDFHFRIPLTVKVEIGWDFKNKIEYEK